MLHNSLVSILQDSVAAAPVVTLSAAEVRSASIFLQHLVGAPADAVNRISSSNFLADLVEVVETRKRLNMAAICKPPSVSHLWKLARVPPAPSTSLQSSNVERVWVME